MEFFSPKFCIVWTKIFRQFSDSRKFTVGNSLAPPLVDARCVPTAAKCRSAHCLHREDSPSVGLRVLCCTVLSWKIISAQMTGCSAFRSVSSREALTSSSVQSVNCCSAALHRGLLCAVMLSVGWVNTCVKTALARPTPAPQCSDLSQIPREGRCSRCWFRERRLSRNSDPNPRKDARKRWLTSRACGRPITDDVAY